MTCISNKLENIIFFINNLEKKPLLYNIHSNKLININSLFKKRHWVINKEIKKCITLIFNWRKSIEPFYLQLIIVILCTIYSKHSST